MTRRRAAGSLCLRWAAPLRAAIRGSQGTRLGRLVTPQAKGTADDDLASGWAELQDGLRFFQHFRGRLEPADLGDLRILDLGCGYGGRTVFYATACGARDVVGVEPFPEVIARCEALAQAAEAPAATFRVARAEELPFDDGSFDAVISFDVIEHVQDPAAAFREIARVLTPEGRAWLVFPTYLGARSSHLDFITLVPGLHRIFDPHTIVAVVNEELAASGGRYGVRRLAEPWVSPLGHLVLPSLNGLRRAEAKALIAAAGLASRETVEPAITGDEFPAARYVARALDAWQRRRDLPDLPDLLIRSLAYEAWKSGVG